MTRFYNSGLYQAPFFRQHKIETNRLDACIDDISYDFALLSEYYADEIEDEDNEDKIMQIIEENFFEAVSYWPIYFEPLVFNKKIALECALIPFVFEDTELLALAACGMDLSPRLDAYQALTDCTIDESSYLFSDFDYFEYVVGKTLTKKVLQVISYAR